MQKHRPAGRVGALVVVSVLAFTVAAPAQDYSVLRINEVIAENESTGPADVGGGFTDMVEIYNSGDVDLILGFTNPFSGVALSDTEDLPPTREDDEVQGYTFPYTFNNGIKILARGYLTVLCDNNAAEDFCEPHASFQIASDGSEPVTLWGPVVGVDDDGLVVRRILDQVWLPPLRGDVSFGRFPDGAGPAPVPLDQVLDVFVYHPPGTSRFGTCVPTLANCGEGRKVRACLGAPNTPEGNITPRVGIETYSTNTPAAGEAVTFRVKVDDEKGPAPPNIDRVEIRYRVNGGAEQSVAMAYDAVTGIEQGVIRDADDQITGPNPFDFWAFYDGAIPGQAAGALVDFYIHVRDADGGEDQTPDVLCAEGVGPCERDTGGPGCQKNPLDLDTDCTPPVSRYHPCRKPFHYVVAHTVRADVAPLVINEVVPAQVGKLTDVTEGSCSEEELAECPASLPNCCPLIEDFIELYNSSPTQAIDLSGLWLSDGPFNPQVWQFPTSAVIAPGEYLIVWLDRDGGLCPDPELDPRPCSWECPDPTSVGAKEYHTNFALNADGDEIFLFDTEANNFAVIHGVRFAGLNANESQSLAPNGRRDGCWVIDPSPTVSNGGVGSPPRGGLANDVSCPGVNFQRGDSNSSCRVDISDATATLNFLFAGTSRPQCPDSADSNDDGRIDISDAVFVLGFLFLGLPEPPAPGPTDPGSDPTEDTLDPCVDPAC